MRMPRWFLVLVLVLFLGWTAHRPLVQILVDYLWFGATGHELLFTTALYAKAGLWIAGLLLYVSFLGINVRMALSKAPLNYMRLGMLLAEGNINPRQLRQLVRWGLVAFCVLPSLLFAQLAASQWLDVLSFVHQQPFGTVDTVFGKDIGFFVFQLPMLRFGYTLFINLLVLTLLPVGAIYGVHAVVEGGTVAKLSGAGRKHLLFLVSLIFLVLGSGWMLDRYDLLFNQNGVVWGMGYTDLHARLPGFLVLAASSLLCALAFFSAIFTKGWKRPAIATGLYIAVRMIAVSVYPTILQEYYVKPNELDLEREYLVANIQATNEAYALDRIEVKPFEAETGLTMNEIESNPLTIDNVRLWDSRPLLTTYSQLQEIRLYYDFADVDVDRYIIEGSLRQVMLSARELNYENVPAQARSWVNEHFQYTHGYGMTMSPVNVVASNGMPSLFIQDIPPTSAIGIEIDQPEIYYGELTDRYVLVQTSAEEFDYPSGDQNVYTRYAGQGGVGIGTFGRKALFALYYRSFNIMLSKYLQPESRILLRRQIDERVETLTPFLQFDQDPYLVVEEGRLFWIYDAYTTTHHYPYSEPVSVGRRQRINYIRNSVKVVVDAYHGTVDYYLSDTDDPVIQTYSKIFPETFLPLEDMPDFLREHVRYPSDFFDIQATVYRSYHMQDPTVFYNKEDMWELPRELYGRQEQPMESYYLIMKLPGEESAEFINLIPFVPSRKDNMISWLAARSDAPHYGNLILYQFPKQKLIYGPRQVEARIDQDPEISELITLWGQSGSRVVRGNLIVIPIEDSLMYVEPLYLQAESSQLPELKRVIVVYEDRIAMRQNLDEALLEVFGPATPDVPAPTLVVTPQDTGEASEDSLVQSTPEAVESDLALRAQRQFQEAIDRQREGDWAGYGAQIDALGVTLEALLEEREAP